MKPVFFSVIVSGGAITHWSDGIQLTFGYGKATYLGLGRKIFKKASAVLGGL